MKLFYREDGQSIVIIAVAIALILFIGLGVYNFSEVLNVKAKFRNLSDSASFAGVSAQTKSIYTWLSFNNISPMVVISYQMDDAFNILDDAAGYLVAKSPNYDQTANTINTSTQENIFEDLDKIIKKIAHEPKNPTDLETVDPIFYNYLLSFYELDGLILAREISENNRNYILNNLNNFTCYTLPSEIILLRAPIQFGTNTNSKRYKFKIMMKHGKIVIKYHDQIEDEYANSGFFNISIADTPITLYQNILPVTESAKIGKIVAFSNSCPYSDVGPDEETPLLDIINSFITVFEDINEENVSLVDHMKKNKNNKTRLQADWDEIISNYNSLYAYVVDNELLSYFRFDQKENYLNAPVFSSLKGLELLNIDDYKTIASGKGLNPNNPGDSEKFYKTLSFKDIFQTQQNMKYIIEESIDSFTNNKGILKINMSNLMTKLREFNVNYNNGENVPAILNNYVQNIEVNVSNSTLTNFLDLISTIYWSINVSYSLIADFNTLINFRDSYNLNLLKPTDDFYTNIGNFFDTPIVRFEGS